MRFCGAEGTAGSNHVYLRVQPHGRLIADHPSFTGSGSCGSCRRRTLSVRSKHTPPGLVCSAYCTSALPRYATPSHRVGVRGQIAIAATAIASDIAPTNTAATLRIVRLLYQPCSVRTAGVGTRMSRKDCLSTKFTKTHEGNKKRIRKTPARFRLS